MKLTLVSTSGTVVTVYAAADGTVSCRQFSRACKALGSPAVAVQYHSGRDVIARPVRSAPCEQVMFDCRHSLFAEPCGMGI